MEKSTISRNQLVNQIIQIEHGNLDNFLKTGLIAAKDEPELFAHLIAWNEKKGEIRDSKLALPIIALRGESDKELFENAIAHLCLLDPRNLVRAIEFNKKIKNITPPSGAMLKYAVKEYLKIREANKGWWTRTALQHRKSLKALYALYHVKPNRFAQDVLFDRKKPKGSVFEALANLKNMNPLEAAGTILHYKIPFIVAVGAVGGIKNNTDIILALIEQTSGNELINSTGMFSRLGVFQNPVLKVAFDQAVERAKKDKRTTTYKANKAVEKITDKKAIKKIQEVHEEKLEQLGTIDGSWLVLVDRSGSMRQAIEIGKFVGASIAERVKDSVYLVFFDTSPTKYDITGKSLDEIKEMTKRVMPGGATSISCGLDMMLQNNIAVNGIAIVSDGGENRSPLFADVYKKYVNKIGIEPTVYLLHVPGDPDDFSRYCKERDVQVQKLDVSRVDYYAIPNLIKTLRSNMYSLVDEMMNIPLLKFSDVFKNKEE